MIPMISEPAAAPKATPAILRMSRYAGVETVVLVSDSSATKRHCLHMSYSCY